MSEDEQLSDFDVFQEALKDEGFRRRFTEVDQLESQYEIQSFCPTIGLRYIQTDGEEMTIADGQRQTVREAIQRSAFEDPIMRDFGEANNFELGDVLARARKLGGGDPRLHDTSIAQDIVVLIRGFTIG